jgi:hypothetical protein
LAQVARVAQADIGALGAGREAVRAAAQPKMAGLKVVAKALRAKVPEVRAREVKAAEAREAVRAPV